MLLQISEPGQSTIKEACKQRVVGIDLGTTNSLVAYVDRRRAGRDRRRSDRAVGRALRPERQRHRRRRAKRRLEHRTSLASVKRLIGRGLKDVESVRAMLPYELVGDDRAVRVEDRRARGLARRGFGRDPEGAEAARGSRARRPDRRRRDHRAGVLRRRAAPGHARCRPARRARGHAPDGRADGRGGRVRPRSRISKASTRCSISAAARSTSRS